MIEGDGEATGEDENPKVDYSHWHALTTISFLHKPKIAVLDHMIHDHDKALTSFDNAKEKKATRYQSVFLLDILTSAGSGTWHLETAASTS